MSAKQPFVSIIIVNFNGKHLLAKCLDALFNIDYPGNNLEVIVVDNNSKDGSVGFIKEGYKKAKIIENKVNNYCQACNLGILSAKGEYVVLLNNDVIVREKWLLELVGTVKNDSSIGAVTSKLLKEDGSIQNAGLIELPNFYWDERGAGKKPEEYNNVVEVDAISGASVLYRRTALDSVGLLDEDFVMYTEDVDMSYRLKKDGWKLIYTPASVAYHKMHGSCDESFAREAIEKNRLLFIAKHHPHKLANALVGSEYFIVKEEKQGSGRLFDLLPSIFLKLIKEYNQAVVEVMIKEVLVELKRSVNYENKKLEEIIKNYFLNFKKEAKEKEDLLLENKKLEELLKNNYSDFKKEAKEKECLLIDKSNQVDNLSRQLDSINNELKKYKEENSNLLSILKTSLDNGLFKDNLIFERDRHAEELSHQLHSLNEELKSLREENSNLLERLKTSLDNGLFKDNLIFERDRHAEELSHQLHSLNEELKSLREENSNLLERLKTSLDNGFFKDGIIFDNNQQLEQLIVKLNKIENELSSIYNSTGFRFILSPLWKVIWHSRVILKNLVKRIRHLIWSSAIIFLSPIVLLQILLFIIEYMAEKLFGKLLLHLKKGRKIAPFDKLSVSIVIPNWNGIELLKRCLSSIYEADGFKEGKYEVLVVDDASEYDIANRIKDDFPKVRVIRNNYNQGFGRTCNRGIKEAKGELIVLLNNDIMVSRDFLWPLMSHFEDDQVFAVAPKLYYWDKKTFNYGMHMGEFKDGYLNLWNESETGEGDRIRQTAPTIFAVGGAMCFRKEDFLWLGGFDDLYRPNCWEDIDISYRAQKRGLKVLYEPKSLVYHKGAATLNYVRHKEIKNELLFMWKNLTNPGMLLNHLNQLPKFLYYGRHSSRLTFIKGYFWALCCFVPCLVQRFREARYIKVKDEYILNKCLLYYKNFKRNGYIYSGKKTILIVTSFIIYPLDNGGKLRIYNLCKRLAKEYNLLLLSLIHSEQERDYIDSLKETFKEVHVIHTKTASKELLFPKRYKYSFSYFFIEKFNEIMERLPIDLIHIESNELLYLTKHIKGMPIVYTEHDISILSYMKSYYKKGFNDYFSSFIDYLKIVHYHNSVYERITKVIVLSKEDLKVVNAFSPRADCSLIPTGVDLNHFRFQKKSGKNKSLVFVGHYQHYPNEESVVYFCKNIFPIIKKLIPGVTLKLVGSNPTESVIKLSQLDGIEVIGSVADVNPYLQDSAVFVCPFQRSAGIKGKVLEAMSTGTPVVSTTRGAYGIDAINGVSILIADTPGDFAKRVVELFSDEELYNKISFNARKLVEEKYDWAKIVNKLGSVYSEIIGDNLGVASQKELGYQNYQNKEDGTGQKQIYDDKDGGELSAEIITEEAGPIADKNRISFEDVTERVNKIIDLSLESLSKEKRIEINLSPEELHLELTHSCNSKCIMCDIWDYHQRSGKSIKDEISLKEIRSLINNSKRLKELKTVVLSGGEPFLRPDFYDICISIKNLLPQASLGILTNGIDTEAIISGVKRIVEKTKSNSLWIGSSLDGLGDMHDKIRGTKGSFENFVKTVDRFKKELPKVPFSATFVLTPHNVDHLIPCFEFSEEKNLDFFAQFGVLKQSRSASIFQWKDEDYLKIKDYAARIVEKIITKSSDLRAVNNSLMAVSDKINFLTKIYFWSNLVDFQLGKKSFSYHCDAASKFAMFDPYGNLFFCPLLKNKQIGNIREKCFDELWISEEANQIKGFISSNKCSCWLVCTVFPAVGRALSLYGDEAAANLLRNDNTLAHLNDTGEIGSGIGLLFSEKNKHDERGNLDLNNKEFREKTIILRSSPQDITIGANYKCNASCVFCLGGKYKPFSPELYKNYFQPRLGSMISQAKTVSFCGMGELLLIPDVNDFLKYLNKTLFKKNKILTTNGVALKNCLSDILIEDNYNIQISLHASVSKLHEQLTGLNDEFDKIIRQVSYIISRRKNKRSPYIIFVFLINTLNIEDLPNFVELAASLGVDCIQCNYLTSFKKSDLKLSCFFKQEVTNEMFNQAMQRAEELKITLKLPPKFSSGDYFKTMCSAPWKSIYVDTEGAVLPCCFSGQHFGELKDNDISSIWNNSKYQKMRMDLASGSAVSMCKYCLNSNPENINLLNSHVSFRPEVEKIIL